MNKREGARGNKRYERTFEVYHFLADRIPFAKMACDSPTLGVPKVVTRRENRSREKERDRERRKRYRQTRVLATKHTENYIVHAYIRFDKVTAGRGKTSRIECNSTSMRENARKSIVSLHLGT